VSDNTRVYGNAQVYGDAQVSGNAWVSGDANLTQTHECVSVSNLNWTLTSLPEGVQVGCKFLSMKEWKAQYLEIGKAHKLTEDESKTYYQLVLSIRKIQKLKALYLKENKDIKK
jgi:hypothetical protein